MGRTVETDEPRPYPQVPVDDISINQIGENWLKLKEDALIAKADDSYSLGPALGYRPRSIYSTYTSVQEEVSDFKAFENLVAKLTSAEKELASTRIELLKIKIERDMACSERNMALQALVKMVETRLINSRDAAAKAEMNSPGAQVLNAIAVTQKTNRVR